MGDGGSRVVPVARPVRAPKPVPAQRRPGPRAIIFYPLLGLVCLAAAMASFLVLASPADIVRDRLIAQTKARLDRHLSVGGGASLTVFPFGVLLRDVELSASPDAPGPALVRAAAVDVRVSPLSLLAQRVVVTAVTMTQPEIDLSIDAEGRRSWDFASPENGTGKVPVRLAQLAPRLGFGRDLPPDLFEGHRRQTGGSAARRLDTSLLDPETAIDVRVLDGTIRYSDARSGAAKEVTGVNLRAGLGGGAQPAHMSGGFVWSGEQVSLEARVDALEKTSAHVDIRLKSRVLEAGYSGRLPLAGAFELDGQLTGRAPSFGALVEWAQGSKPRTEPGAAAVIAGRVKLAGAVAALTDATFTTNGTTATGSVSVDISQPKPVVRADLELAALDLGRAQGTSDSAGQPPRAPGAADKSRSIDDLLQRSDGKDAGAESPAARSHWTTRPFDHSVLRLADLDARLDIGTLRWHGLVAGPSRFTAKILDGKLTAQAVEAQLYGGRAHGTLVVEPKGEQAAVSLNTTIDGVATQAMLKGLLDFDWLDGRGQLTLALSGEGASEKQIVDSLHGRGEIKVADGALVGWDLNQMLRGLRQGNLPATDRNPSARTSFGELTGSFAIADGVAQNEDLKVTGQAVDLSGGGSIVYRDRTINYTVRAKLAEPAGGLEDIEFPVRIYGAWDKPVLSPDLDGVLKDPRTAAKVQQLGRKLRSGNVDEALKGVLGDGPEAEKKAEKAKAFLKRFLKQ